MTSSTSPTKPTDLPYGELRALFINCTLTKSPGESHTDLLIHAVAELMREQGVTTEFVRAVDEDLPPGVSHDMTEAGAASDGWPALYERVMAADILVLGTPLWLGEKSSVCTAVIERLYGSGGRYNDAGQFPYYGKVGGWIVTGNEDGVKHASMNLAYSLSHLGFTVPPNCDAGWIGEIGPGASFGDDGGTGYDNPFTHRNVSLMTWNLLHMAAILRQHGGVPAWGTSMEAWKEQGERFGTPPLRELIDA